MRINGIDFERGMSWWSDTDHCLILLRGVTKTAKERVRYSRYSRKEEKRRERAKTELYIRSSVNRSKKIRYTKHTTNKWKN